MGLSMATAYAKEIEESHEIVLENKTVVVEKVHVTGLKRTKADYILKDLQSLLKCTTFLEAYQSSLACKNQLLQKGIFQNIDILLDTTESYDNAREKGIQVIFKVKERSFVCGEAKTEMSNTEKPRWVMRVISPNLFGRGEAVAVSLSNSLTGPSLSPIYQPTDFSATFSKPCQNNRKLQVSLLQEKQDCSWSQYDQILRGAQCGYEFLLFGNQHNLQWQVDWRELSCSSGLAAFDVRKQMGHSLKSSLSHSMLIDKADDAILPKSGFILKLFEEIAGLGGNVKFLKEKFDFSIHTTVLRSITFGAGLQTGFMIPYGGEKKTCISDRFFIGGPLTLRGFHLNSVGKESCGSFLGSSAFWLVGGHAYIPLPFYWSKFGRGSWLDNFRLHAFVNAGNSFDVDSTQSFKNNFRNAGKHFRLSYGFGILYKFMNAARFELNCCFPLRARSGDVVCDGLQFGIGVTSV